MIDAVEPNGLVPTLMVFGELPSLPITYDSYRMHAEKVSALRTAREEMSSFVAPSRSAEALSSSLPPAARYKIDPGDRVRAFRERPGRW